MRVVGRAGGRSKKVYFCRARVSGLGAVGRLAGAGRGAVRGARAYAVGVRGGWGGLVSVAGAGNAKPPAGWWAGGGLRG